MLRTFNFRGFLICLLVVIESRAGQSASHVAPKFTAEPKDVFVAEGKSVMLPCRATGNPAPRFGWKRNGIDILFTSGGTEQLSSSGDLTITKVDKSHIGRYQCVVRVVYSATSLKILSRTANLRLAEFPTAFSNDPQPVTGYTGGSVRLSVDISNFQPAPQVAWLYRGSGSMLGTDPKYTVLPQGVIQISNIGLENKGDIQAIARNTIDGSQMRGKFVSVNILPANQRPPAKSASASISIIGKPKDIVLKWGRSTILECLADAPSTVVYSWLKDGKPLSISGRYSMYGPGNLKITTAREEDAAKYTCKAQSGGAVVTADANVVVNVPPQFSIIPVSPTYGVVDGDVTFNYRVIGSPKPSLSWMRDGVPLSADASYLELGDGFLRASGLIQSDAGMYQVFARNSAGESQASAELIINEVGKVTTTAIPTSKPGGSSLSPGRPKNVNAYAKSPTEIYVSWQPPDISNGEIISYKILYYPTSDFQKFKTKTISGDKTFTMIQGLEPNTEYNIKVGASNKHGGGALSGSYITKTSASGSVAPNAVSSMSSGSITSSSIQLNWPAPRGSAVTKYTVYYSDVDNDPIGVTQIQTSTTTYAFTNLRPSTNYEFWVKAYNGDAAGPVSTRYKFKTLPAASPETSVENLRISSTSSSIIVLNWDIPAGVPQPDSHQVYYVDMDRAPNSQSVLTVDSVLRAFVQNLKASTNYKFWVVPSLKGKRGKKSNEVTATTEIGVPNIGPKGLHIVSSSNSSLTIKWTALTQDEGNGPITGYYIKYKIPGVKSSIGYLRYKSSLSFQSLMTTEITGLKNDTEYSIRVAGTTSKGDGPFSSAVKGKTKKANGPSEPVEFLLSINPGNPRQLLLSWVKPKSYSGSIQRYEIQQSIDGGAWITNVVGGTAIKLNVSSNMPASQYRFKIRAHDIYGWSPYTDTLTVTSMDDTTAPGPVRNLHSTSTAKGLTINWGEPSNHRSVFVSGYEIYIKDKTDATNVFDVIKVDGWWSLSYEISKGIVPEHTYDCIVKAVNQKGMKSTPEITTILVPVAPAVIEIDDVKIGERSITFNWTDALGAVGSKYLVTYTKYDGEGRGEEVNLEAFKPTITIKGLTPYTQYKFTVQREIAVKGTGASITRRTHSDVPSAPVDVTARSNDTWVLLNWQVPLYPNGVLKTYRILYTTDNSQVDSERIPKNVGGNVMTYNVTGLTTATKYYFNVIAVNDAGAGPKSETAAIKTGVGFTPFKVPGGKVDPGGQVHSPDDLDSKLWWIILVIVLLLLLLLLLFLLLYCCCCRKKGHDCCQCCFACFDTYCLPCLICLFPCCFKNRDGEKGAYAAATPVNGFGKVKKDAPPDLWRGAGGGVAAMKVQETELQPLKANEFDTAVPVGGSLTAESYSRAASNGSLNSSRSGAGIRVAVPGDATFISYKTSLNDYCHKTGWLQPHFNTFQEKGGYISNVVCGGHQYGGVGDLGNTKQESEQRAAFFALQGLGVLPGTAKFGADASITVPSPGEQSFISYKCSLYDFCQQCNILPPRFTTTVKSQGYGSQVNIGSYTFTTDSPSHSSQDAEQKVAYTAVHGLSMMESSAQYSPNACFTVPCPGDASFISFKSSLHDFCQRYKLPPPQYITTQMAQGYSAKLKFGGLFFQSSDYFNTRLESEQHAAFEALQGLGLLESGVKFGSGDTERVSSRPGSQLSLSSTGGGEGRGLGSRAASHSRHGSASQLSYTSSTQQTSESSALYRSDTVQSDALGGYSGGGTPIGGGAVNGYSGVATSFTVGGGGYGGGTANGYSSGSEGKTVFISKTTIPRVERSNTYGTAERSLEKTSESRFGNGMSYTVSYQHSTVRNVATLPRKQPTYTSSSNGGYSQFSSATTKLSNNRRAYSSSTAVNDDGGQRDFPEVRSSSHPALTDLEREMAGLEGLIKDLNGITASPQAVQT